MLKVLYFCLFLVAIEGHSVNKLQNDADMQSELMPQELNPSFYTEKDQPWKAVLPIVRTRREVAVVEEQTTSVSHALKKYSRIVACVVLALSAIIEIVLYVLDFYFS